MAACGSAQYIDDCESRIDIRFVNALANHTASSSVSKRFLEVTIHGKNKKTKETTKSKAEALPKKLRFDMASLVESKSTSRCSSRKIYEMDRNPTTRFSTHSSPRGSKPDFGFINELALESLPSAEDEKEELLKGAPIRRFVKSDSGLRTTTTEEEDIGPLKREDTLVRMATGEVISKKLATQEELDGKILAHVYFTTARSGKWPPFIISVPKGYNFMKLMRKAIAGMQKSIRKGERPCHDWIFKYHVNKQVPKMRKELKVLFGRTKVEFRGTNLNKGLESANLDPLVNRFWILPKK